MRPRRTELSIVTIIAITVRTTGAAITGPRYRLRRFGP